MFIKSTTLVVLAVLSTATMAGETPAGSHAPTLMYWWCQASSTSYASNPAKVTYYSSDVFENDSAKTKMSQRELGDAFWKYLVAKYGLPASNQSGLCIPSKSTSDANAYKADQLRQFMMNKTTKVIETGWTGS